MNPIKRSLTVALLLSAVVGMSATASAQTEEPVDLEALYQEIDATIGESPHFVKERVLKIDDCRRKLQAEQSAEKRLELAEKLFSLFQPYRNDSALYYIEQCINLADSLKRPDLEGRFRAQMAHRCSGIRMYSEAFEQLKLIRKSALDQVGLSYYYGAWMHLYGELGSYTERPGMQQVYYDQQNAYRDSVLMVAPEGTDDWYHMKMDILNGRRYYQEALQFSNRWIRNAPPNSHARAFAAFYRSMVYSNLHNEEQTRYWLGRSAIEDIKCGVMDQASLLFLAEHLANDGDIERAQRYLEFSKKCNDYFCHHMRSYQVNSVIAIIEKSREAAEERASLWFTVSMVVTALLLLTLIIVIIRKIKK